MLKDKSLVVEMGNERRLHKEHAPIVSSKGHTLLAIFAKCEEVECFSRKLPKTTRIWRANVREKGANHLIIYRMY